MIDLYHVIKDPVHGTMQFTTHEDHWIKPFIDSPLFQRLRHIKQLGMTDYIFPGAVHTRFNHSLGCCFTAKQIALKLGISDEQKQLVMVAALLHDIGHGPFSHTFEDVFYNRLIRHEAWTPFFLKDYGTNHFFESYNRYNPKYHLSQEKFKLIEDMIMHTSQKTFLSDIVSSQLDADRLDYLLRDSHFCGVEYGEYDYRWMLHSMLIVKTTEGERLGLTHKGIGVVEHYLMARRLMTRNIYHHRKKLAFEFFLVQLLRSLSIHLETEPFLEKIKLTRLGKFLMAVNQFNQLAQQTKERDVLKQNFLNKNYFNYKELCDYDVLAMIRMLAEIENEHEVCQIAKRLQHRMMPKIIQIDDLDPRIIEEQITHFKNKNAISNWQMELIKTPHQSYTIEEDPILIANELGVVRPLNQMSHLINAISDKAEESAFLSIDQEIAEDDKVVDFVRQLTLNVIA